MERNVLLDNHLNVLLVKVKYYYYNISETKMHSFNIKFIHKQGINVNLRLFCDFRFLLPSFSTSYSVTFFFCINFLFQLISLILIKLSYSFNLATKICSTCFLLVSNLLIY